VRPPPLPQQIDVLQRVLERVATMQDDGGPPPFVVFDLDGTLYDNRQRTLQILTEYADEVELEYPEVAGCLRPLEVENVRYLLSTTLKDCGLTHVDVVRDITSYWQQRFFNDEYMSYDVPFEGAPEYVSACHESGATVVYLTGRDVPGMLLGTVASLRDHGFPFGVAGVELVLKPDATLSDEAFKRSALPTLGRVGRLVGFFDNEPANCNQALAAYPDAEVALLETQKVPGAPEPVAGVYHVTDFRIL
jgi:hypothetical protein